MSEQRFLAAAIALAFSFIDMLDGLVARKFGKASEFGAFLDSTMDRVSDFLVIAGFYAADLISLNLAAGLLLVTFLISYIRSRAELASNNQVKFNMGLIERPERIIFLLIVIIIEIVFPSTTLSTPLIELLLLLSLITVAQRVLFAYKKLN